MGEGVGVEGFGRNPCLSAHEPVSPQGKSGYNSRINSRAARKGGIVLLGKIMNRNPASRKRI
jgi:hypothetical protein